MVVSVAVNNLLKNVQGLTCYVRGRIEKMEKTSTDHSERRLWNTHVPTPLKFYKK